MQEKSNPPKTARIGEELDELDLYIEPIPVQVRRTRRERIEDALILVASAVAAQIIIALVL